MARISTGKDYEMYQILRDLKRTSKCVDKQVACIIVDADYNVLSTGVNTIVECNKNCDDKENRICNVRHAEVVAVNNLSAMNVAKAKKAYVSLFPCAPCQETIDPFVNEIVTFGMAHKNWESEKITVLPHPIYTLSEMNLPKAIERIKFGYDKFHMMHPIHFASEHIVDLISDTQFAIDLLSTVAQESNKDLYNDLRKATGEYRLSDNANKYMQRNGLKEKP